VANGAVGIVLVTPGDIVQISCRQQHVHFYAFDGPDTVAQPVNPERVIPVVTAAGILKIGVGHSPYRVEHIIQNRNMKVDNCRKEVFPSIRMEMPATYTNTSSACNHHFQRICVFAGRVVKL
jgi:hypothetical protein